MRHSRAGLEIRASNVLMLSQDSCRAAIEAKHGGAASNDMWY